MVIGIEQLWNNMLLFLIMAVAIELSLSGLFAIKFLNEILTRSGVDSYNFKTLMVIIIAFGMCIHIPQLRILYKSTIQIPNLIHLTLSAFILSRVVELLHNWFKKIANSQV